MRELFTRGLRGGLQKDTELGPLPDSWAVVPLGSLGRIGNGSTPKRSVSDYWANGEVPWLNSGTLYDREIKSSGQYISGVALKECHLPIVKPGAVLIAITGQGKTLGHCAVLHIEATVSQHVAYVQVDPSLAESGYVRGYLETQYDALRQVAAGGGSTKGALTCGYLRGVLLPLPHLDEQRQIVAILDAIDSKTAMHRRKAAILDELFGVLLHELVTGQIRVHDLEAATIAGGSLAETAS
jgi:type I restriction enzyme S subunit